MANKEELINALKVLVSYCNQYDSDVCLEYQSKDYTPPHECIFWDTCYFDYYTVCDTLKYKLEELEKNVGE